MTTLSAKTAAITALVTLGSLISGTAHANILRTSEGVPVLTTDGNCVLTGTDGTHGEKCGYPSAMITQEERTFYFDFNKSTLTPHAKHKLDHLAKKLHDNGYHMITVVGYADRIGSASYNEKLALHRAKSVEEYLVSKGIKSRRIEVRSLGKSDPRSSCPADMPRGKLIDCLHVDRRVEVEFGEMK